MIEMKRKALTRPCLGFTGYKTAGKDTALVELMRRYAPGAFCRIGFVDELKVDCHPLVEAIRKYCPGFDPYSNPDHKEVMRPLWVAHSRVLKTATGNEMIWIDRAKRKIRTWDISDGAPAFTDVRYWYEVAMVLESGGVVVYIERPGVGPAAGTEEAESFREIFEWYPGLPRVLNAGTKADLGEECYALLERL